MTAEQHEPKKEIRAYQVGQLYIRYQVAAPLMLALITILIIIQWPVINHWILLGWWTVMCLITGLR